MCSDCPDMTCQCSSGYSDPDNPESVVCGYDSSFSHPDRPGCRNCKHDDDAS